MRITLRNSARGLSSLLGGLLVLALLASAVPPVSAGQQVSRKLNHTLAANQHVLDFAVAPDGSRIVYRVARTLPPAQDNPPPPPADLFSVPANGGVAVQLNPPAENEVESVASYRFTPDGSEVVYLRTTTDATLGNVFELFRVPIDGAATAISVSGAIAVGSSAIADFRFTFEPATIQPSIGDGTANTVNLSIRHGEVPERITNIADGTSNTFFFGEQVNNLLQFPYEGTAQQLNPNLTGGGVVYDFQITPDGTRAIYRADQNIDGAIELFSVPADGSDAGFRISGPLPAGGDVIRFQVNANSTRAIYLADGTSNGVVELYSARTNGGIVARLNAPLTAGGAVTDFALSADGDLVAYLADAFVDGKFDLFAVASAGSATTLLSRGRTGRTVRAFAVSPDGAAVFFVETATSGGPLALFRRPLALGATLLTEFGSPPVANVAVPDLKFNGDGSRLVYLADSGNDGVFELASLTAAGAFAAPLNGPLPSGGNIRAFQISPDGGRVVYAADQNTVGTIELFSVPIDGGVVDQVSGPLATGGNVGTRPGDIGFSPDGSTVYYLADAETDGVTELFAAVAAPVVTFTQRGYVVAEDGSLVTQLAVQRSGSVVAPAGVRVQLTGHPDGGTANGGASLGPPASGVDFVDNVREVAFAAGEIVRTFTVTIKEDNIAEAAEDFTMTLFEPVAAVLGTEDAVKVVILDTADSPLLDDRSFSLPENSAAGTPVPPQAAVTGAAVDATAATTYTIRAGNTNNAFGIDTTGALFVDNSAALDYEITPSFALVVEANADNGAFGVATWLVTLLDQNEAPVFANQVRSVAENSSIGRLVGSPLVASDPDGDALTFTTASALFAVSTGGQLRVQDSRFLDFETQTQHTFNVTVADGSGLSKTASVRVNILDVAEGDATAPAIATLSPASVVAGGKSFKLSVAGKNLTENSVVRWNGSKRTTLFDGRFLIASIPATDISAVTTAKIDVLDAKSGKTADAVAFAVTKGKVGIAELTIDGGGAAGSLVGQTTLFDLAWTHTSEPWRRMDEMDLRLIDGDQIPLWVRYQETRGENGNDSSRIILLNADGTPAGSGRFGEDLVLENDSVRLDLAAASFQGSGDTGSQIAVQLAVVFKPGAGRDTPYAIEMYGVDDLGGEQGPNIMGEWRVSEVLYLPAVVR